MNKKGQPKRDGSGKGIGANKGRGGCPKPTGRNKKKTNFGKFFIFMFMIVLLLGVASAWEFDNVGQYDPNTRTMTIVNGFGLGNDIATIQLTSSIHERVGMGYQKVAQFNMAVFEDYNEAFKELELYNYSNSSKPKFNRDHDWKFLTTEKTKVDEWVKECYTNQSTGNETCIMVIDGWHWEWLPVWETIHNSDWMAGEVLTVGLFTEVAEDDYVEWIPNFFGVRIDEWATWTADLNVGLISYLTLDESSGNALDSVNSNDATLVATPTQSATGKLGTAYDFDVNDYLSDNNHPTTSNSNGSISLWINMDSLTGQPALVGSGKTTATTPYGGLRLDGAKIVFFMHDGSFQSLITTTNNEITTNTWYHVAVTVNETTAIYVNGARVANTVAYADGMWFDGISTDTFSYGIHARSANYGAMDGTLDEIGIWDRALTGAEVTQLYNGGTGITYDALDNDAPIVTQISPANDTTESTTGSKNFVCYGSDDKNFTSMEFYLDGSLNQTNYTGLNNTNYTFTTSFTDGTYLWSCLGNDNQSESTSTVNRTLTIDTTPFIEFVSPTPVDTANLSDNPTLNVTLTETYFENVTFNINGTEVTYTDTTRSYTPSLADGYYSYNVTTWTTTGKSNTTEQRTFTIERILPIITLTSPESLTNYFTIGDSLNLNWTVTDDNLDSCWYTYGDTVSYSPDDNLFDEDIATKVDYLDEHYINYTTTKDSFVINLLGVGAIGGGTPANISTTINSTICDGGTYELRVSDGSAFDYNLYCQKDSSWVDLGAFGKDYSYEVWIDDVYPKTIQSNALTTLTCGDNTTTFTPVSGENNLTFYANDTFGNLASQVRTWSYGILENSRTFNATSYETQQETYSIDLTANASLTAVNLYYNDTKYATTNSGNVWSLTRDIPSTQVGNNSMIWGFVYAGTEVNSTMSYQNVLPAVFTLCNATYTDDFFNITFRDEVTLSSINATIPTSNFIYYLGNGSETKTYTYVSTDLQYSYEFCATPDLTFHTDPYVQYKQGTEYPQRIYDPGLTDFTSTVTEQNLYLLNSLDGIYVTFQIINRAEASLENVLIYGTRIISGFTIAVANALTDSSGTATFWLNPDFQHNFTFSKTGYNSYNTLLSPTQSAYTLILSTSTDTDPTCAQGNTAEATPTSDYLDQETDYNFTFVITSNFWNLDNYTSSLYYGNGTLIETVSGDTATGESFNFTENINTGTSSTFYNIYSYYANGSACYSNTKNWITQPTTGRAFSITRLFTDTNSYFDNNLYGVNGSTGNPNFTKGLLVFFVLVSMIGITINQYGLKSETAIMGLIFGLVAMFDVGLGMIPAISVFGNDGVQYLVTIITAAFFAVFLIKGDRL